MVLFATTERPSWPYKSVTRLPLRHALSPHRQTKSPFQILHQEKQMACIGRRRIETMMTIECRRGGGMSRPANRFNASKTGPLDASRFLSKSFLPAPLSGLADALRGIFTVVTMLLDEDVDMNVLSPDRFRSTVSFIPSHPRWTTWAKHPPRCRKEP